MNNIIQTQNFSISPNSLIHSVNTSDFTCCICLNIFFDPIILKCCEKLLCITCLESYFHSNKTCLKCPYCNNKSLSFSLPPQLINRLFEGLRFNTIRRILMTNLLNFLITKLAPNKKNSLLAEKVAIILTKLMRFFLRLFGLRLTLKQFQFRNCKGDLQSVILGLAR